MVVERRKFELFADYHQFVLQDEAAELDISGDLWPGTTYDDMLFLTPGMIHIGTARNMTVPVEVEISDIPPDDNFGNWDHVTQYSIAIPTGKLVVLGCTDYFPEATRIKVVPGHYRARIYYGGLDTLNWNGLEGDDHYKVIFWQGDPVEPTVLKRRPKQYNFG